MAFKITQGDSFWQEIHRYNVDLFGAFEGKYVLEERRVQGLMYGDGHCLTEEQKNKIGQIEIEVYHRDGDGKIGGKAQTLEVYLLVLENYNQWKKEQQKENKHKQLDIL